MCPVYPVRQAYGALPGMDERKYSLLAEALASVANDGADHQEHSSAGLTIRAQQHTAYEYEYNFTGSSEGAHRPERFRNRIKTSFERSPTKLEHMPPSGYSAESDSKRLRSDYNK